MMRESFGSGVAVVRGEQYLTKTSQYGLVYNNGDTRVTKLVLLKAMPNGLGLSRYGFSVSSRVGNAVVRNKVKRLLREILRHTPLKPGWDIIFIARSKAAEAKFVDFEHSVHILLSRAGLLIE
ncbi:ribonuclease P protein component [Chloroflexota bacterium]